jgi:uncharacterized integral membrane protein
VSSRNSRRRSGGRSVPAGDEGQSNIDPPDVEDEENSDDVDGDTDEDDEYEDDEYEDEVESDEYEDDEYEDDEYEDDEYEDEDESDEYDEEEDEAGSDDEKSVATARSSRTTRRGTPESAPAQTNDRGQGRVRPDNARSNDRPDEPAPSGADTSAPTPPSVLSWLRGSIAPRPGTLPASEEEAVNKLQHNEQLIGLSSAGLLVVLVIIDAVDYLRDTKVSYHSFGWEILGVGIPLAVLLAAGSLTRRRALLGFASLFVGLGLTTFGFGIVGILYVVFGSWLIFRALRLQKAVRDGTLGNQRTASGNRRGASEGAGGARGTKASGGDTSRSTRRGGRGGAATPATPQASKRYTPPRKAGVAARRSASPTRSAVARARASAAAQKGADRKRAARTSGVSDPRANAGRAKARAATGPGSETSATGRTAERGRSVLGGTRSSGSARAAPRRSRRDGDSPNQ